VIRAATTIAGGRVLDPAPARQRDAARLALLRDDDPAAILRATVHAPIERERLEQRGLLTAEELRRGLAAGSFVEAGDWVLAVAWLEAFEQGLRRQLEARSGSLDPGVPIPAEPWGAAVVALLDLDRRGSRLYVRGDTGGLGGHAAEASAIAEELREGAVVRLDDRELARFLEADGLLVRLGEGYAISVAAYERARDAVVRECTDAGQITLSRFRDLIGKGRRDAQLLLERFDSDGLTRRVGDARVLRRRHTA
jgi:hypothetical protein